MRTKLKYLFSLQVIDFDVFIEGNTKTDVYRGTKDWTTPEMRKQDGPTPMQHIKANSHIGVLV